MDVDIINANISSFPLRKINHKPPHAIPKPNNMFVVMRSELFEHNKHSEIIKHIPDI